MRETKTETIGDVKFIVKQHRLFDGLRLGARLAKMGRSALEGVNFQDESSVGLALFGLAGEIAELDESAYRDLMAKLFAHTQIEFQFDGKRRVSSADLAALEDAIGSRFNVLLHAIAFVLKTNFQQSFADGMREFAALMPEVVAASEESPSS